MTDMKIEVYHLTIRGIFGRNRKSKFEMVVLKEVPAGTEVSEEELRRLAAAKIAEIKVKSGRLAVTKTKGAIETMDGVQFRVMEIELGVDNTVIDLGTV